MAANASRLSIVDYRDDLAHHFRDINAAWIDSMYVMEPHDRDVLNDPRRFIIDPGGHILFVALDGEIVGAGALMPVGDGAVELTKMGVTEAARGHKAGEYLLAALIERGRSMRPNRLFLLTNRKSQAAIHLYEKLGFVHDAEVMRLYGASYDRCDVAMNFPLYRVGTPARSSSGPRRPVIHRPNIRKSDASDHNG